MFGDTPPRLSLQKGSYADISITSISYNSDGRLTIAFNIIGPKGNQSQSVIFNRTADEIADFFIMVIVSNVEVKKLAKNVTQSAATAFTEALKNQYTYKFGNQDYELNASGDVLSYGNLTAMTDTDYSDMENKTPILPGDYVIFAGKDTLNNIPRQQFPRTTSQETSVDFEDKLGIVVYKRNKNNDTPYTMVKNDLVSSTDNTQSLIGDAIPLHRAQIKKNILLKNNTIPSIDEVSPLSLKQLYPFLFKEWNLITPNFDSIEEENVQTQYLSFNAVNNKSNVFMSIKDNFNQPLYAQSPQKGSRRSKVLLNDKLPQRWVISKTDNTGINKMFYITTFSNQPKYYLGVDGDKVVSSLLGQQTKQFWKIEKVENEENVYTIMSAYNGRFLAYASEGGYLYQNRGRVFLTDTDKSSAPQWKFVHNLDGQYSMTDLQEPNNDTLETFKPMFAARDTPVTMSKNTGRGPWNSSFTQYWNGNYIYCFTNKGRETTANKKNYLNINLDDSGKGVIKIDPQNMVLENETIDISPQKINRYGGYYNMNALTSDLLWGKHALNDNVYLLLEMLDVNLPKNTNWVKTLSLPNPIGIKVKIYDKGKIVSLCGTTWNDRKKMSSYCTKVVETFTPNNIVEHLASQQTSFDPTVAATGSMAQSTGAGAGNYPVKEGQGYGHINQGPALTGATAYQDPDLNPCRAGPGQKIAIPNWFSDTRVQQVRGTCVTNYSDFNGQNRIDPSGQPCSSSKYLSGVITGIPDTYKGIPATTQQFSGKSNKNIIQWKGSCLPPDMTGPGVYQAYYKTNNLPAIGYGYWKKKNWMVSTFMIPQYDKNAPVYYIDQNGNQRTQQQYIDSPQTVAYTIADLTLPREPWNNFWIWNNNANVVCQELPASRKNEAFAQLFGTNGSLKYYKFMQIPSGNYRHNLQSCKTQYDNSSTKVVCLRVRDLDPINSPTRNFWRNDSRKVVICDVPRFKATEWYGYVNGHMQPSEYFATTKSGPLKQRNVRFVRLATGNAEYNSKNASTQFIMPYFFRQGGQDMRYNYPTMPKKLVEIRGYNDRYNGKYEKSKYEQNDKPIWIKQGGNPNTSPALRWNLVGWNLCETKESTCHGSYGRQGYVPSSTTNNYEYNFINTTKDLENLLPTGVPIGTWDYKNFPNGPRIYPVMDNDLQPCVISGVTVPGWYQDERFGQTRQCITFPRGKAADRCCNTTYSQGSKRGQQVTYDGKPACNTNWSWSGYNAGGVKNWINWCIR